VLAAAGCPPAVGLTDTAHALRAGFSGVRHTAQRWEHKAQQAAEGAAERVSGAARTARTQGAARVGRDGQDQLPILVSLHVQHEQFAVHAPVAPRRIFAHQPQYQGAD